MAEWIYGTLAKFGYVHPLHPIMGHLPLGLIIAAFIFQWYGVVFKRPHLFETVHHCLNLALIGWLPTFLLGYLDWQYRYQGEWLHPIVMKIILSIILLLFLSFVAVPRRVTPLTPKAILVITTLCLLTVTGIGFYGAELIYKKQIPVRQSDRLNRGASFFKEHCLACHVSDSTEKTIAVGLKGVMKRETLPVSKQPATEENIRKLLKMSPEGMPSFAGLNEDEVDALIAYLKTL